MGEIKLASDYWVRYEGTDVVITYCKTNEDTGVTITETSDGKFWFSDNNETVEVEESFNPYCIIWKDNFGWINDDGTEIKYK